MAAAAGVTTDEKLVLPNQDAWLAGVLPSVAAGLGVPGAEASLAIPAADGYVVVLIDGLGERLLRRHGADAPYLAGLADRPQNSPLTCGVPSTTVTSLTSLGTGLGAGRHGIAGYTFFAPEIGRVLNPLGWDRRLRPEKFQPHPTWLERAEAAGVHTSTVSLAQFEGSGLTRASLRGGRWIGLEAEAAAEERIAAIVGASAEGPSLVYAYDRDVDHTGHALGCRSPQWLDQLRRVDRFCSELRRALPERVRLLVTADHGMVDVPGRNHLIVEDEPSMLADVAVMAGEGRLRHLYLERSADAAAVQRRWIDRLGDHAWVRTRDEAADEGWFGELDPSVAGRFGDVLVAMRTDWAVMTRTLRHEMELVGMHGSLTADEMMVPLLID